MDVSPGARFEASPDPPPELGKKRAHLTPDSPQGVQGNEAASGAAPTGELPSATNITSSGLPEPLNG